jgi:hypothetical protein
MFKRISYANVAATLALVLSMSGGAFAAGHYLISSTKQISPKVLKKLKGRTGKQGVPGATGEKGLQGERGLAGTNGTNGVKGERGERGERGEQGEQGETGEIGPSAAYEEKALTSTNIFSTAKTIFVALEAGKYDVSAKAQVQNKEGLSAATVTCELKPEGEAALDSMVLTFSSSGEGLVVLHSGFEKASGAATIQFTCTKTAGTSKEVFDVHPTLSAIKVGALH